MGKVVHVTPEYDRYYHKIQPDCWCRPTSYDPCPECNGEGECVVCGGEGLIRTSTGAIYVHKHSVGGNSGRWVTTLQRNRSS